MEGVPTCVIPSSCDQIDCEDPFICIVLASRQLGTIAQCSPNTLPRSCANTECNGTCLDITQNGRIVSTYCSILNCEEGDVCPSELPSECIDTLTSDGIESEITSVCAPTDILSLKLGVSCDQRIGECEMLGEVCEDVSQELGSLCGIPMPPQQEGVSCDDVTCEDGETCLMTTAPLFDPNFLLLQCVDDFSFGSGISGSGISGSGSGDSTASPPTDASCDDIVCEEDTDCVILFDTPICLPVVGTSCEELGCVLFNRQCVEDGDLFRCVPVSNCAELELGCRSLAQTCEEVEGVPTCIIPTSCDQINCEDPFICIVLASRQLGTIAQCSPNTLPRSCANTECNGTCLDITQNGRIVSTYCSILNCEEGDVCPSELPSECIDTLFDGIKSEMTSICAPTDISSLELGVSCDQRIGECEMLGEACEDVSQELGSLCGVPMPPQQEGDSCDDVTCEDGETCVMTTAPLFDPSYLLLQCIGFGGSGIPGPGGSASGFASGSEAEE